RSLAWSGSTSALSTRRVEASVMACVVAAGQCREGSACSAVRGWLSASAASALSDRSAVQAKALIERLRMMVSLTRYGVVIVVAPFVGWYRGDIRACITVFPFSYRLSFPSCESRCLCGGVPSGNLPNCAAIPFCRPRRPCRATLQAGNEGNGRMNGTHVFAKGFSGALVLAALLAASGCDQAPEDKPVVEQQGDVEALVSEVAQVAGESEDDSAVCGRLATLLAALPQASEMDGLAESYRGCESPMTAN